MGLGLAAGCQRSETPHPVVVLYTSVDEPYVSPLVKIFTQRTGIEVELRTDAEANKTAGLAERLEAEKSNPQADVYWGNEVFHTIRLAEAGVLEKYTSPSAKDVLDRYKDPRGYWAGVGLRARVIAYRGDERWTKPPAELWDLTRPEFKGRIVMARPTAGTTGSQVAALYVVWGKEKTEEFFASLHRNEVHLVGGNSIVADEVGRGSYVAGLTDNDDCASTLAEGGKLEVLLPDQKGMGTLTMPTTVALVAGAKHPEEARKLIDFLLSAEAEQHLIKSHFAGWSVRNESAELKVMQVDYQEVARVMPQAIRQVMAILEGR